MVKGGIVFLWALVIFFLVDVGDEVCQPSLALSLLYSTFYLHFYPYRYFVHISISDTKEWISNMSEKIRRKTTKNYTVCADNTKAKISRAFPLLRVDGLAIFCYRSRCCTLLRSEHIVWASEIQPACLTSVPRGFSRPSPHVSFSATQGVCVSPSTRVQHGLLSHNSLWSPSLCNSAEDPITLWLTSKCLRQPSPRDDAVRKKRSQSTQRTDIYNSCYHIRAAPVYTSYLQGHDAWVYCPSKSLMFDMLLVN